MATAKRVPQSGTYKYETVTDYYRTYTTVEKNGVETSRQEVGTPAMTSVIKAISVPQPDRIHLDLSVEEARSLRMVTGSVGGSPDGRRGHIDAIRRSLIALNISSAETCQRVSLLS